MKVHLALLLLLLAALPGVNPQRFTEIHVREGEMVQLSCPQKYNHGDAKLTWTSSSKQKLDLTNTLSAEQMGVLLHDRNLIILRASVNHQGNYSCSLGSGGRRSWFRLSVYTPQSRDYEDTWYDQQCHTKESCTLHCPDDNTPAGNNPHITSKGITWHKEGRLLPEGGNFFMSVEMNDNGIYNCTRSYLYLDKIYKKSFIVELKVGEKEFLNYAVIKLPRDNDTVEVDLGSTVVIDCKADIFSIKDEVFWSSGDLFVEKNDTLPVFYNTTRNTDKNEMTASLVFKKVSEEDLLKSYTCKLESFSQTSSFVTITLALKTYFSTVPLAVSIVGILAMMVITAVLYMKFKIDIALFLRDSLGCHTTTPDGKSYDAFLMCYESNTDAGLNACDRQWLETVLEENFGYRLCLYDRDVLPGEAVAEVVLDCIERSRAVVLVPTLPDVGPESGLQSAIHEALVERQTRLVFIKTEATEASGSLPEVLQHLGEAGRCVTWRGASSKRLSSSFWKQLRFYLPATQHAFKIWLSPQVMTHDGLLQL